jgi:hypothetical protein
MLYRRMFCDYRDLSLSVANIADPVILTKNPQPLSNRFIEGIGSHLNGVVHTLKISATHYAIAHGHSDREP